MHSPLTAWLPLACGVALSLTTSEARADEGGVGFWPPGTFGSLAAVPSAPGWSLATIYYHTSADARVSHTFSKGGTVVAGLRARTDFVFALPTYTFAQPVASAQAALGVMAGVGAVRVSTDVTLSGPAGQAVGFNASDSTTGGADLYGLGTLKWGRDEHNFMTYAMVGAPAGAYERRRLANVGTNHWSVDAGGGYTYFDPRTGREFSAVAGVTYNFENPNTDYRNGVDAHIDWAASQFFSESLHAGIVGYLYQQLTGDSGAGAVLGDFKSRTYAIGPQVGWLFPVGSAKGYVNLRGYWEFAADHRPEGWNVWLTVGLPLGGAVH